MATLPGNNPETLWIAVNDNAQPRVLKPISELVGADATERGRIVSVFGPPRTGKSTMLNALGRKVNAPGGVGPYGSRKWFGESAGVESFTKGVHAAMWCDRGTDQAESMPLAWLDCEGKGDAGAEFDTSLKLPLFMLSRVVVWNVRTVARDDLLKAADDVLVAAESLMQSMEAQEEIEVGPAEGEDEDEGDNGDALPPAIQRAVQCTRNMFGHLVIVLRDCDLKGDASQLLLEDEQVEFRSRRGATVPRTKRDAESLKRNERRAALRHCFESVTVVKLATPSDSGAPMKDPRFSAGMDALLTQVQALARQPLDVGPQSLQCPMLAAVAAPPANGASVAAGAATAMDTGESTFQWLQDAADRIVAVLCNHGIPHPSGLRAELEEQQAARQREAELQAQRDLMQAEVERQASQFQAHIADMERQAEAREAEVAKLAQRQEAEVARLVAEGKATSEALQRTQEEMQLHQQQAQRQQAEVERARQQHAQESALLHERLKANEQAAAAAREAMAKQQVESAQRQEELQKQIVELRNRPPTQIVQKRPSFLSRLASVVTAVATGWTCGKPIRI